MSRTPARPEPPRRGLRDGIILSVILRRPAAAVWSFLFSRAQPEALYAKDAVSVRPWPNTTTEHRSFARVMACRAAVADAPGCQRQNAAPATANPVVFELDKNRSRA